MIRRTLPLLVLLPVAAQATLIDGFTDGAYAVSLSSGSDLNVATAPLVLGGTRTTKLAVVSNTLGGTADLTVGNGFAFIDNGSGVQSQAGLGYGRIPGAPSAQLLNYSFLADGGMLRLDFDANDLPLDLRIEFGTFLGEVFTTSTASRIVAGDRPTTAFSETFTLADFVGAANPADVDYILITATPQVGGDFGLTRIETVPEPASMAVLGLGLAALKRRRKNR